MIKNLSFTITIFLFALSAADVKSQTFSMIGNFGNELKEYSGASYYFGYVGSEQGLFRVAEDNIPVLIKEAHVVGNLLDYSSVIYNSKIVYTATEYSWPDENDTYGGELWMSDGTTNGTNMILDIYPGMNEFDEANSSNPSDYIELNGKLLFIASDAEHGRELWTTDGTVSGTQLVKDIYPGTTDSYISWFTIYQNQLYFVANHPSYGSELWISDGTEDGTNLFAETSVGTSSFNPLALCVAGDMLYFVAKTDQAPNTYNYELWASDGETVWMVEDINGTEDGSVASYGSYINFENRLYFWADDGVHGKELWTSDGTAEGTYMVKDMDEGPGDAEQRDAFIFNEKLYFKAHSTASNSYNLWSSDGTEEGTQLIFTLNETYSNYVFPAFTALNGKLYFEASHDEFGSQLWNYNPTTEMFSRLMPPGISTVDAMGLSLASNALNSIYYNARYNEAEFFKLWRYQDGTVGIDENEQAINFSMMPNPTSNELFVALNPNHDFDSVFIFDTTGKIFYSKKLSTHAFNLSLDINALASGVYFIKLQNAEGLSAIKRFVKN